MLVGVVGFLGRRCVERGIAITVFVVHSLNVGLFCILTDPQYRYQSQSVCLAIIGAGLGVWRIWTLVFRSQKTSRFPSVARA